MTRMSSRTSSLALVTLLLVFAWYGSSSSQEPGRFSLVELLGDSREAVREKVEQARRQGRLRASFGSNLGVEIQLGKSEFALRAEYFEDRLVRLVLISDEEKIDGFSCPTQSKERWVRLTKILSARFGEPTHASKFPFNFFDRGKANDCAIGYRWSDSIRRPSISKEGEERSDTFSQWSSVKGPVYLILYQKDDAKGWLSQTTDFATESLTGNAVASDFWTTRSLKVLLLDEAAWNRKNQIEEAEQERKEEISEDVELF